jgi:hypothetical protein
LVDARTETGTGVVSFRGLIFMRIRRTLALVTLTVAIPATLAAQGRGILPGRGALGPGRGPGNIARDAGIQIPKYANGVNLLIEHRPELALSDSQFTRIVAIKRALDSTNSPLVRKLDSVQHLFKTGTPIFSSPSAAHRDSVSNARAFVSETVGAIRDNIGVWRDRAYATLSPLQLARARDLEEKAEKAASEENQQSGGGQGKRGGRPPSS